MNGFITDILIKQFPALTRFSRLVAFLNQLKN